MQHPGLERTFGLFRCPCDRASTWASVHVYCVWGTSKVVFKQKCQECKTPRKPFRVQHLICPNCRRVLNKCRCEWDDSDDESDDEPELVDHHRRDLCMKCISNYPCVSAERRRRRR